MKSYENPRNREKCTKRLFIQVSKQGGCDVNSNQNENIETEVIQSKNTESKKIYLSISIRILSNIYMSKGVVIYLSIYRRGTYF